MFNNQNQHLKYYNLKGLKKYTQSDKRLTKDANHFLCSLLHERLLSWNGQPVLCVFEPHEGLQTHRTPANH